MLTRVGADFLIRMGITSPSAWGASWNKLKQVQRYSMGVIVHSTIPQLATLPYFSLHPSYPFLIHILKSYQIYSGFMSDPIFFSSSFLSFPLPGPQGGNSSTQSDSLQAPRTQMYDLDLSCPDNGFGYHYGDFCQFIYVFMLL